MNGLALKLKESHLSISELPSLELPPFTILTGLNGAGKTHLLQAILNGKIEVSGINPKQIRYYDWTNFAPIIPESSNPHQTHQNRKTAIKHILQLREQAIRQTQTTHRFNSFENAEPLLKLDPLRTSEKELKELLKTCTLRAHTPTRFIPDIQVQNTAKHVISSRNQVISNLKQQLSNYGPLVATLEEKITPQNPNLLCFSEVEYQDALQVYWPSHNVLELQFANWFCSWFAAWEYNRMTRYHFAQDLSIHDGQSEEDFRKQFGPEPWDLANKALEQAQMRYRFNKPIAGYDTLHDNFQLKLEDPNDGTSISPKDYHLVRKSF